MNASSAAVCCPSASSSLSGSSPASWSPATRGGAATGPGEASPAASAAPPVDVRPRLRATPLPTAASLLLALRFARAPPARRHAQARVRSPHDRHLLAQHHAPVTSAFLPRATSCILSRKLSGPGGLAAAASRSASSPSPPAASPSSPSSPPSSSSPSSATQPPPQLSKHLGLQLLQAQLLLPARLLGRRVALRVRHAGQDACSGTQTGCATGPNCACR